MGTAYADTKQMEITERAESVLRLRGQRMSWRSIGTTLGISHEQARKDYKAALAIAMETRRASADEYLEDTLAVYEQLLANSLPIALRGDVDMHNVVLRTLDQRSKLLGLYPQGEATGTGSGSTFVINYNGANVTIDNRQQTAIVQPGHPVISPPALIASRGDSTDDAISNDDDL